MADLTIYYDGEQFAVPDDTTDPLVENRVVYYFTDDRQDAVETWRNIQERKLKEKPKDRPKFRKVSPDRMAELEDM